jgi:hypothetical protein
MKNILITITAVILVTTVSCKSKTQKNARDYMNKIEETMKENSPAQSDDQRKPNGSFRIPDDMKNILGEWELTKIIGDRNDNHQIDPAEEKDAITTMKDFLTLKADGTCEFTIAKLEARYEIVTKDDGRKKLIMYDRTGGELNSGRYILSVTDNELVINRISGGSDFEVFKRL